MMMQRCFQPTNNRYQDWGGRGITVCERWRSFENFLEDMGERPLGMTLDRFPNRTGNYEPGNCRWATITQQNLNQGNRKDNQSGCRGVSYVKASKTWRVRVHKNNNTWLLYNGPDYEKAVAIRKAWEAENV